MSRSEVEKRSVTSAEDRKWFLQPQSAHSIAQRVLHLYSFKVDYIVTTCYFKSTFRCSQVTCLDRKHNIQFVL